MPKEKILRWLNADRKVQEKVCANANKILCVSHQLKKRFIDLYKIDETIIEIFPCLADSDKYQYNLETRKKYREKLNIKDKYPDDMLIVGVDKKRNFFALTFVKNMLEIVSLSFNYENLE